MNTFDVTGRILAPDYFQKRAEFHLKRLDELLAAIHQGTETEQQLQTTAEIIQGNIGMDADMADRFCLSKKEQEAGEAIGKARRHFHFHFHFSFDPVETAAEARGAKSELEFWLSRRA